MKIESMTGTSSEIQEVMSSFVRLMRTVQLTHSGMNEAWVDASLTMAQLRVLALLCANPEGMSGRHLAAALGVGPSAITPLVDRLVEHGYARRAEDPADRRVTRIYQTEEGQSLVERGMVGRRDHLVAILSQLDDRELKVVKQAFDALSRSAEKVACTSSTDVSPQPVPTPVCSAGLATADVVSEVL